MRDKKNLEFNIKDRLHIATFSKDAVREARDNGLGLEINHICISENLDKERFGQTLKEIISDIEGAGFKEEFVLNKSLGRDVKHLVLHGPFTEICPGSIDHRAVDLGLERLNEAYEMAMELGLNSMVVHSGYMPMIYHKEWHLEKSLEFWRRFLADKPKFTLFLENVFDDEPYMLKSLIDDFNDSRLKLCLDVGHANVLTSKELPVTRWIEILGKRIAHFHLHNNYGDKDQHLPLGEGNLYMREILRTIEKHCDFNVTMTLESTDCGECIKWLKENKYL